MISTNQDGRQCNIPTGVLLLMSISAPHKREVLRHPPPKSFIPTPPSISTDSSNKDGQTIRTFRYHSISVRCYQNRDHHHKGPLSPPAFSCFDHLNVPVDLPAPIPAREPVHCYACHEDESKCRERDGSVWLECHQRRHGRWGRLGDGKAWFS